jgi:heat shock protein HtpX
MAYEHRLAKPKLFVLPEFSPNAMALRGPKSSIDIVLSEGLLQVLTQRELDAVLLLLLAQASFRDAARAARLSYYLAPLCSSLDKLPLIFWFMLSPIISGFARIYLRPGRVYRADRRAVYWSQSPDLAHTLQKLSSLLRKMPMRRWNLAYDHLFLLSPMQIESNGIPFVTTHPPITQRLHRLLEQGLGH